jgi:hypothetical protein
MRGRDTGFYYLVPRGNPRIWVIGHWNGQFWKVYSSVARLVDDHFAAIGDGPEHLRPNLTPAQEAVVLGSFVA